MATPTLALYWLMNGGSGKFPTVDPLDILNYQPLPQYVNFMSAKLDQDSQGNVFVNIPPDIAVQLKQGKVKILNDHNIKVVLSIYNNPNRQLGWSTLTRAQNQQLIASLGGIFEANAFAGIDIDDEEVYSGSPENFYFTVTDIRMAFRDIVISNPVYDAQDEAKYTYVPPSPLPPLADLMTYCATMNYGDSYDNIVQMVKQFNQDGIPLSKLCAGIQPGPPDDSSCGNYSFTSIPTSLQVATWAKSNCMGVMIFSFSQDIVTFTSCPQYTPYPNPNDHGWQKAVSEVLFG